MPNWIILVKNNILHLFCVSWKLNYLSYKNYLNLTSEPQNYPLKISLNLSLTKIFQKWYHAFISLWFLVVIIHRKILWEWFKTQKYGTHSSKVIIIGIPIPIPIKLLIFFSSRIRMKHSMCNHLVFHFSHWSCFCIWQVWTKFSIGHFI